MKNGNFEFSWEKERLDTLKVQLLTPVGYKHLGWMSGVTNATLIEDYDSDTRVQGTITTIAPESYIDLAMVRLIHDSKWPNGTSARETLGTFFVIRTGDSWSSGVQEVTFELKSVLYGMKDDLAPDSLTLAKGSYGIDAFAKICDLCKRPKTSLVSKDNNRQLANMTLDAGKSYLSWLHEVAERDGMRIDVNTSGQVTYDKDLGFAKSPTLSLAHNADVVMGGVAMSSDLSTVASRSIVTWDYEYDEQVRDGVYKSNYTDSDGVYHAKGSAKYKTKKAHRPITAWADVEAGHPAHIGRRGWRKAVYHKYSGDEYSDNASKSQAQNMAKSLLKDDSAATTEWTIPMLYVPDIHAGDVIRWKPQGGDYRKCLVTSIQKELYHYTMTVTLREA